MALDTFDTGGDRVVSAPCGCRLLVNGAGEWAMQAPCSPRYWSDWKHQTAAADAVLPVVREITPDEWRSKQRHGYAQVNPDGSRWVLSNEGGATVLERVRVKWWAR